MAAALVAGVLALVLLPVATAASGAQEPGVGPRAIEPFELTMSEGELLIRDAEEPFPLEDPTTIAGDHDTGDDGTGAVSNGTFDSPQLTFITESSGVEVTVDAAFSQVSHASGTGFIDAEGNVTFETSLTVVLDISALGGTITGSCTSTPVNIQLDSVSPYVPGTDGEPGHVTLEDADFTVPEVEGESCTPLISSGVNEQLAGSGHSLTMSMVGDLVLPPVPGCPSLTDLAVAPATSDLGDEITLTATVEPDPAFSDDPLCEEAEGVTPGGLVEFRDGDQVVGTTELDGSGVATLVTTKLPAGGRTLTARYRGLAPYASSLAEPVGHTVSAPPAITTDYPEVIQAGADPVEFDVTVTNTGFGNEVINARVDLVLDSVTGGGVQASHVTLEYHDGDDWQTVPVTRQVRYAIGSLGPATGQPLAVGEQLTLRARLSIGEPGGPPNPGEMTATFELIEVDPTTGDPAPTTPTDSEELASLEVDSLLAYAERTETSFGPGTDVQSDPTRQGQSVQVGVQLQGLFVGRPPTGTYQAFLDGQPVPVGVRGQAGFHPEVEIDSSVFVAIPENAPTGERELTIKYSGDVVFAPSHWTGPITILASRGPTWECGASVLGDTFPFWANVTTFANLPSARPSGSEAALSQFDVNVYLPRYDLMSAIAFSFPPSTPVGPPAGPGAPAFTSVGFTLDPSGSGTATDVTFANPFPTGPESDLTLGFEGESGSVSIDGAPGDIVPVEFSDIAIQGELFGALPINCIPLAGPINLGEVTISGTALTVDAPSPTREGDSVTLTADVAPAGTSGTVQFLDGDDTIGVVPIEDGSASMTTYDLAPGTHTLTARTFGGLVSVSTTSAPVALTVLPVHDCASFVEEGNGAVVRLVYMELLERCPDQAGFDYWVGRLDGGTTPEVFARTIARSTEAVGLVVDDAYETMLGRTPDADGRAFWVTRLQGHGRYDQLLADLAGSGEFWALSGSTNEGFVTRVYERLLDRSPDQGGLDYWVGRLDGGTSRKVLVRSLANQDEPLGRIVGSSYEEILGRAPVSAERSDGIEYLRDTGNRSGLYAQLIGRPEFDTRAQGFPNPED